MASKHTKYFQVPILSSIINARLNWLYLQLLALLKICQTGFAPQQLDTLCLKEPKSQHFATPTIVWNTMWAIKLCVMHHNLAVMVGWL